MSAATWLHHRPMVTKLLIAPALAFLVTIGLLAACAVGFHTQAGYLRNMGDDQDLVISVAQAFREISTTHALLYRITAQGTNSTNFMDASQLDMNAAVAEIESHLTAAEKTVAKLAAAMPAVDGLQKVKADIAAYHEILKKVTDLASLGSASAMKKILEADKAFLALQGPFVSLQKQLQDVSQQRQDAADQYSARIQLGLTIGAALGLLAMTLISFWLARLLVRRVRILSESVTTLASGQTDIAAIGTRYRDELGRIETAVMVFRNKLEENHRLVAAQQATAAANAARQQRLEEAVHRFGQQIESIVRHVAQAVDQLHGSASDLKETAGAANDQADAVAGASAEASTNVGAIASAVEELAGSLAEISRHVQESHRISSTAIDRGRITHEQMSALTGAAERVGEITGLIRDIARQTNLLALNATIEAARAGEAGSGFAVVAGEVRSLADQTGRAVAEIGERISEIRDACSSVANSTGDVLSIIQQMTGLSSAIADAVESQNGATKGIAVNMQAAAARTATVSSTIQDLSRAAGTTGTGAHQVFNAADALSELGRHLRQEVDVFLKVVEAA